MPEKALNKPLVLVTKVDYQWNHKKSCSDKTPQTEPASVALERWSTTIREVVSSTLDCRDISMGELSKLEHIAAQIENAKEYS
jgi:hypothetical protein